MNETMATELLKRFRSGECTDVEKQLVEAWYSELINTGDVEWEEGERESIQNTAENWLLQNIADDEQSYVPVRRMHTAAKAWWAAAAILVLMTGAAYYLYSKQQAAMVAKKETLKNDVEPGSNKAVLTLANGTTIVLDDASNGVVAQEGNSKVLKPEDGQLLYAQEEGSSKTGPLSYNTLATPRSGQYQVILPDGTKVWLNSESSIHYPIAFAENERRVQITGEAYFEVAKQKLSSGARVPFIVERGNIQVEVLGTHFNVNAYSDESAIKTTLLEGKVKVVKTTGEAQQSAILAPGEQAVVVQKGKANRPENDKIKINKTDVEDVVAWKNGLFHFENADIKTVMRQIARWYDVDIVYVGTTMKNDPLFIEVSRNTRLSDVLKVLNESGSAKFTIEDKKIVVK